MAESRAKTFSIGFRTTSLERDLSDAVVKEIMILTAFMNHLKTSRIHHQVIKYYLIIIH